MISQFVLLLLIIKTMNQKGGIKSKYLDRPSPPHPANENCGKTKKGNDGKMYKSVPNKNGVCTWKKVAKR